MNDDPFDLLSQSRPDDRPLQPGDNPAADDLLARIVASDPTATPTSGVTRRRGRWGAGVVVVTVVAGGTAAAAAWWAARPSDTTTIACYSDASTDPDVQVALPRDPDLTPAQQCEPLWSDGTIGDTGAPPLASCVTAAGIVAVVPSNGETCSTFGLTPADTGGEGGEGDVATQVANVISEQYPRDCVANADDAVAVIETLLEDIDADDWTVTVAGDTNDDDRPCWYAAVVADTQTVLVVNAAAPPSP